MSVILITHNEEADLPGCLESLQGLRAEIVVVDNYSTDRTPAIARGCTPRVYARAFDDFAGQKQSALEKAGGDWALSIDADERVTPELAAEILKTLEQNPPVSGFMIPFEVHFMGRRLRFGGLGRERHLRLFRKSRGRFVGGKLHEGVEVQGTVGRLQGAIRHFPYRDLDEYLGKTARYTSLAAQKRRAAGRRAGPLGHLLPLWEFFVRAVLRLGFLDGAPGLAWAGLSAFHVWMRHLKLRELEGRTS